MDIQFKHLHFCIENERIYLIGLDQIDFADRGPMCEVQVAGEIKDSHLGIKMIKSSEGHKLRYVEHTQSENVLEIVQDIAETVAYLLKMRKTASVADEIELHRETKEPFM